MSYEEDYRRPYRAKCACGKGYLKYYEISYSNDWGQRREENTAVELFCDSCKENYHYEHNWYDYLVPNGLTFPKNEPHLDYKYHYDSKEEVLQKYGKEGIEAIIADMTAPKHTYIRDLTTETAFSFANEWYRRHGKKSLKPMIEFLQNILKDFDNIKASCDKKKVKLDKYDEEYKIYYEEKERVEDQSFKLTFQYDSVQDEKDREEAKRKREQYEEEHRYDDFTATVKYDKAFRKDLVNQYWDSYLIKECIDSQHFSLNKPIVGTPEILIAKKYLCVCQLCGKEREVLSSDFKIKYDNEYGYSPEPCCDCHSVSSFEAKVMEILNNLGITYIREKTFEGLVGDSGKYLRFDFALYKNRNDAGEPVVDLVIELQGPHHYKEGYYDEYGEFITDDFDYGINTGKRLERQLRYDKKKEEFCENHNINFECIKYTASGDYERLEKKLIEILQTNGYRYWY